MTTGHQQASDGSRIDGDTLQVTAKAVMEDCGIRWELKVMGSKLQGATPGGNATVLHGWASHTTARGVVRA